MKGLKTKTLGAAIVAAGFVVGAPAVVLAASASDTSAMSTTDTMAPGTMTAAEATTNLSAADVSPAYVKGITQSSNVNVVNFGKIENQATGDAKQQLQSALKKVQQAENLSKIQNAIKSTSAISSQLQAKGFSANDVVAASIGRNGALDVYVKSAS
jgi:hypothetical protein